MLMRTQTGATDMDRFATGGYRTAGAWGFAGDESGATNIEYALIASGISLAIIGIVNTLGTTLNTSYQSVLTALAAP
jgi:pilus assembly protein Flp/PilA